MVRQQRTTEVQVVIKFDKPIIEVHFTYDPSLVKLMRKLQGRYQRLPVPHWAFPSKEKEEVIRALRSKRLCVRIFQQNPSYGPDVVSVLGHCPTCGTYGFYYVNGPNGNKCSKCV